MFGLINSILTALLFLEYYHYRDLTANLLELQSTYESYMINLKQVNHNGCLDETKKFISVDRSALNLKELLKDERERVDAGHDEIRRAPKRQRVANYTTSNEQAIFSWPVAQDSFWISSFFGPRRMGRVVRMHLGIDLAALKGTPIKAAAGGKVIKALYEFGYGNTIVIEHNRKYKTRYAHLDEILVSNGQTVLRGQKIGTVGDTGFVQAEGNNASHLHFEVYAFNKQVNPIRYLPRR